MSRIEPDWMGFIFNLFPSNMIRTIATIPNHYELILKIFWISFDANWLKIKPIQFEASTGINPNQFFNPRLEWFRLKTRIILIQARIERIDSYWSFELSYIYFQPICIKRVSKRFWISSEWLGIALIPIPGEIFGLKLIHWTIRNFLNHSGIYIRTKQFHTDLIRNGLLLTVFPIIINLNHSDRGFILIGSDLKFS